GRRTGLRPEGRSPSEVARVTRAGPDDSGQSDGRLARLLRLLANQLAQLEHSPHSGQENRLRYLFTMFSVDPYRVNLQDLVQEPVDTSAPRGVLRHDFRASLRSLTHHSNKLSKS